MKGIEKIIYYLEYGVGLLKWGINSLRSFPTFQEKGKDEE
jgi:hypothetical protein